MTEVEARMANIQAFFNVERVLLSDKSSPPRQEMQHLSMLFESRLSNSRLAALVRTRSRL